MVKIVPFQCKRTPTQVAEAFIELLLHLHLLIGAAFGLLSCRLYITSHLSLCCCERCELIAMYARPSLPFSAPGVCCRDGLASQTSSGVAAYLHLYIAYEYNYPPVSFIVVITPVSFCLTQNTNTVAKIAALKEKVAQVVDAACSCNSL